MLKNIEGAIFDLDGTLVDSIWVWNQIDINYLKSKGHSIPENLKNQIMHLSFSQTAAYFKQKFNLNDPIEKILGDWHKMAFDHYSNNVKLKIGVKDFLDKLKSMDIKIALATSNSTPLLEACLKNNKIYDYFDSITTTDEVSNGKNCPDVYLLAANKLGVNPKNCLVFEDILPAVQGAKAANMKVIAVRDDDSLDSKESLIKCADMYIDSFLELI
ncbi:HAD family hydrolase [Clostridium saccharobutylicum]|uniref:Haloacid dehalogenase superfamily n=1 Tax=Clostridium saccharobutylicum DSM 13864 TaxID=1345695 RepID=U5N038_CLOSA|nr:HAD family phosphatase [Clostridium saccharobutylicum]AGX45296.1 haloacid dehalogenase superfamily [Clostridium saccharobutylicum DSM 13864]AQR92570.1 phosphorylated carbohydrates phosphatase [Clostridium saccharobutylicum]AQS02472.1 phosphorylated carbohydrates phosphatase [Clostridium saccharobutylicum]AQS12075.1 phosphorylated carbohydrates phosphatase [Clostridium saccharobutylicum]AQS16455.1 phosphorylated carbohydrates phosphatase [Clostridium saccharobutylicum]